MASAGTFFLDEIGEMTPNLQVKLLKVLEERSFRRLGGTQTIHVQFRLIAATNADLNAMMEAGRFRRDLFYRLNVFSIQLPALKERSSDVIEIAMHFIKHFNKEFGRKIQGITPEAQDLLVSYDWPGNIRELRHVIERAVLIEADNYIQANDLAIKMREPRLFTRESGIESGMTPDSAALEIKIPNHGVDFEEVEKQLLRIAMRHNHNNASAAARFLRMTRETLRYRLKKHGIRAHMDLDE
jgi:transcriptional regulator with PAS, ATPase and Fis domain